MISMADGMYDKGDIMQMIQLAGTYRTYYKDQDGSTKFEDKIDPKMAYYMTRNVNSTRYSQFVKMLESAESLADELETLPAPRGPALASDLRRHIKTWRYMSDAKWSESIYDKNNHQQTFSDKAMSARQERIVQVNGDEQLFRFSQQQDDYG